MPQTQSLLRNIADLSAKTKALLFSAVLLMSFMAASMPAVTPKANANPADYMSYNWTYIFYQDEGSAGFLKLLGCKQYRSDPTYGAVYDISLWAVNTTTHHRHFQWVQRRQVPPTTIQFIRAGDVQSTWYGGTQIAQEFSVSAYPYTDIVEGRFQGIPNDASTTIAASKTANQLVDCQ